jgi:hypothetical protein
MNANSKFHFNFAEGTFPSIPKFDQRRTAANHHEGTQLFSIFLLE